MATLTDVAQVSRKVVVGLIIGFFLLALLTYFVRQAQEYARLHPPKVEEKPNLAFGKLEKIAFPKQQFEKLNYHLETATGFLPDPPTLVKVYAFSEVKYPGFDPVAYGREFATRNGFTQNETKLNETEYMWTDKLNPSRTLKFDLRDQSFFIQTDLKNDADIFLSRNLPGKDGGIQVAENFLNSYDLLPDDLSNGEKNVFYYKVSPLGLLLRTILPFEANVMQVVFQRKGTDDKKIFTPDETQGQATVSFARGGESQNDYQVISLSYRFRQINLEKFGTYATKTPAAAWNELTTGKGYVANYGELVEPIVRQVYIGYIDELTPAGYLRPAWVFEGDKGFKGFVDAIAD